MSETLEDKTVQKTIEGLEKQLKAIFFHFEQAIKELEDLKRTYARMLNQQRTRKSILNMMDNDAKEMFRAIRREQLRIWRDKTRVRPYYPRPTARKSYKEKKNKE